MADKILVVLAEKEERWAELIKISLDSISNITIDLVTGDDETKLQTAQTRLKEDKAIRAVISGSFGTATDDTLPFENLLRANENRVPFILLTGIGVEKTWAKKAKDRNYGPGFSVFIKNDWRDADGKLFRAHFESQVNPTHSRPEVK